MAEKYCIKKIDEDDILEILIEHFQDTELFNMAKGCVLGVPGKDLRFIGVFSNKVENMKNINLKKIDETMEYNGEHAFLKLHPEFNIE